MIKLLTTAAFACLLSCNKKSMGPDSSEAGNAVNLASLPVAGNPLYETVGNALKQYNPGEKLIKIDSILFLQYQNKRSRLVYYHSNLGTSNILLYGMDNGAETYAASSTKCSGSCGCVLEVVLQNDGSASLSCSCSDCSLVSRAAVEEGTAP